MKTILWIVVWFMAAALACAAVVMWLSALPARWARTGRETQDALQIALGWWGGLSPMQRVRVRQRQAKRGEGQYVYADTWFLSLDDARVLEVHIAETLGAGNT